MRGRLAGRRVSGLRWSTSFSSDAGPSSARLADVDGWLWTSEAENGSGLSSGGATDEEEVVDGRSSLETGRGRRFSEQRARRHGSTTTTIAGCSTTCFEALSFRLAECGESTAQRKAVSICRSARPSRGETAGLSRDRAPHRASERAAAARRRTRSLERAAAPSRIHPLSLR